MIIIFDARSDIYTDDPIVNKNRIIVALETAQKTYEAYGWLYLRQVYLMLGLKEAAPNINPLFGWDKNQTKDFEWTISRRTDKPDTVIEIEVNPKALS